jgi:rubrerythrin
MKLTTVLDRLHHAWLATQFTSFMSAEDKLYDYSQILFRHFTWVEQRLVQQGIAYSYDRSDVPIRVERLKPMLASLQKLYGELLALCESATDDPLFFRIVKDLEFLHGAVQSFEDREITAFSGKRDYLDLPEEARDALTLFLFEESYKEYELIMVYNYAKAHSGDAYLNRMFQILIDESFFHLKSFGELMAKMGILAVPRMIMQDIYKFDDLSVFLRDGIDEEIAAKGECKELAAKITDPGLSKFFECINYQEDYHIALMEDALGYLEQSEAKKE